MQHTATHTATYAIKARLDTWKAHFENGSQAPEGVEYGDDPLVTAALRSSVRAIWHRALDLEILKDRDPAKPRSSSPAISIEELEAALAG